MRLVVLLSLAAVALATCVVLVSAETNMGVPSARLLSEKVSDTDSNRLSRAEQGTEERFSIQWARALLKRLCVNFLRLFDFKARAVKYWKSAMSTATRGPVSTAEFQKTTPTSSIPSEAGITTNLQDGKKVQPDVIKILAKDVRAFNAGKSENTEHTLLVPLTKVPKSAGHSELIQRPNNIFALRSPNLNAALKEKEGLEQVGETNYYKLMDTGKTQQKDPNFLDLADEGKLSKYLPDWYKPTWFGDVNRDDV